MVNVYSLILAGGKGSRQYNLTKDKAKPGVRFGGTCPLEMMINLLINSGFKKIDVYTEYLSSSLSKIIRAWDIMLGSESGEFCEDYHTQYAILEAMTTGSGQALLEHRKARDGYRQDGLLDDNDIYLITSADHATDLDFADMIRYHKGINSDDEKKVPAHDVTLAVIKMRKEFVVKNYGYVELDKEFNVLRFHEKPDSIEEIAGIEGDEDYCYVNLANTAIRTGLLELAIDRYNPGSKEKFDLSKNILVGLVKDRKELDITVKAYVHQGHWSDIGTLDSLIEAHIDIASVDPRFDMYQRFKKLDGVFKNGSQPHSGEPAKNNVALGPGNLMLNGSIISGYAEHSVLSYGVTLESECIVKSSILFDRAYVGKAAKFYDCLLDEDTIVQSGAEIDPKNLPFWIEGEKIAGIVPRGYKVTLKGEKDNLDHLLIQVSWDGSEIPYDKAGYIQQNDMAKGMIKPQSSISARDGHWQDFAYGNYAEAVLTPNKRLVFSKYSRIPEGVAFGENDVKFTH